MKKFIAIFIILLLVSTAVYAGRMVNYLKDRMSIVTTLYPESGGYTVYFMGDPSGGCVVIMPPKSEIPAAAAVSCDL